MRSVAFLLLFGVFIRHAGVREIAQATGWSTPETFYILGGIWEVVLSGVILLLCSQMRPGLWKAMIVAACLIDISEGTQVAACRIAISDISKVPKGSDLCDYVTGYPIGITMMALYVIILAWSLGRAARTS